jgi:uncharacterized protein
MKKPFPIPVRVSYHCEKCPAFCCTYDEIEVTRRDIERLAKHFDMGFRKAQEKFTKPGAENGARMLRHKKDKVFDSTCMLLDQEKRRCTVYDARPGVCRKYPDSTRCGYYDFLKFEREQQGDEELVALT